MTKKDGFLLPFTDTVLDTVAGHEFYSFLDGYSCYNQIQIASEDQLKTAFVTECFAYRVMPVFGSSDQHKDLLRSCFLKCRSFGISLNPHKCQFAITHGLLLGRIVSRDGLAAFP
ncbi:uncharacterized protein LOC112345922 [Selaginella moellendorffii]|uniref:uncharacterized protein LOC112345922 n=1 Tax=Selaginella moellendorffii TaxID=88036 RepID=UPI000D1CFFCC|nr:uncharacterized protein LOC112345922 [Selaginella moellendorffii]|eukprot:XP_024529406.1 uncharacterized protein LOC112345922 [Selaginella moellendorffii]